MKRTLWPCWVGQVAECDRQMRLADTGGAEEHDVLGALDKSQAGEFVNLGPRYAGGKTEVEAVERLDRRKAGDPRKHLAGSDTACVALGPQRLFKKVGKGGVFRRRALGDPGIQVGQRTQPQLLAQLDDALMLQIAHRTPPANAS